MQISASLCGPFTSPRGDLCFPGMCVCRGVRIQGLHTSPKPHSIPELSALWRNSHVDEEHCLWVAHAISCSVLIAAALLPV